MTSSRIIAAIVATLTLSVVSVAIAQALPGQPAPGAKPAAGAPADPVAALKQNLQVGSKLIRQYEWVETTIINLKGEEKARKQNRCFYGADGKLQKTPIGSEPQKSGGGGGRLKKKIVDGKIAEMTDYMERAGNLIQMYVPPTPERIQASKDAGKMAITPQAAGRMILAFADYLQPADKLTIDLDGAANKLLGLGVNTYLGKPDEVITLAVQMNTLPDGAFYAATTTLEAKAKEIRVVIQNSGYRPIAR